jgi:hypothetical protein
MSDVTNVLLAYDVIDSSPGRLDEINGWLKARLNQRFAEVDGDCVGGSKRLESILYAAAFNRFPEEEFIRFLRGLSWRMRRSVQVILKRQEDVRFVCIDVYQPDETSQDLFDA